jgi:SAM-dependent methyltransferase
MDILKEKLSKIHGGKILDVGTGVGQFTELLRENLGGYDEIVGIDNIERAREGFEKNFPQSNIQFMLMYAQDMKFEDESFDTVCISNSLHHLPNLKGVMDEMIRVLKPGGMFIISEMYCDDQSPKQMSHVYMHHFNAKINRCLGEFHNDTYTREEMVDIATALGLRFEDVFDFIFPGDTKPQDDETIEIASTCDRLMGRAVGLPNYDELKEEADKIKKYIIETGFASSTELMILLRK